jgi:catechol 2,3-dioxygenase-like lactoylglutathione lyase family enzyme
MPILATDTGIEVEIKKQLYGSAPVFFVTDLVKSVDFYVNVLGFGRPRLWGDPPAFAMPDRDGLIVMLSEQDDHSEIRPKENIWDMYFWVRDAKALLEEFAANGVTVTEPLTFKEAYGNLEFTIEDPDGYALAFGQGADVVPRKVPW